MIKEYLSPELGETSERKSERATWIV